MHGWDRFPGRLPYSLCKLPFWIRQLRSQVETQGDGWPHAECKHHRSDTDHATHRPAAGDHRHLNRSPDNSYACARHTLQAGHEAVPWAWAKVGNQVRSAPQADENDTGRNLRQLGCIALGMWDVRKDVLDGGRNDEDIQDGSGTRTLLQRQPKQKPPGNRQKPMQP